MSTEEHCIDQTQKLKSLNNRRLTLNGLAKKQEFYWSETVTCNNRRECSGSFLCVILKLTNRCMRHMSKMSTENFLREIDESLVHFLSDHCRCCIEIWYTAVALHIAYIFQPSVIDVYNIDMNRSP